MEKAAKWWLKFGSAASNAIAALHSIFQILAIERELQSKFQQMRQNAILIFAAAELRSFF